MLKRSIIAFQLALALFIGAIGLSGCEGTGDYQYFNLDKGKYELWFRGSRLAGANERRQVLMKELGQQDLRPIYEPEFSDMTADLIVHNVKSEAKDKNQFPI